MQLGVFCPFKYLCGSVFSTLAYLKNKYRAKLEPENAETVAVYHFATNRPAVWTSPCPDITLTGLSPLSPHTHTHVHAHSSGPQITFWSEWWSLGQNQ